MSEYDEYDAIIVGSGPNGLAAAARLALAGHRVLVREAAGAVGGGTRTEELTLPGFQHDVCASVHPLALAAPYLRSLPLGDYGLEWVHPTIPLAHPFDDGTAALLERSTEATGRTLGRDAEAYRALIDPLVARWDALMPQILGPILRIPRRPILLARFGMHALRSARALATSHFEGREARALFAGIAAHSLAPLEAPPTAAFGLVLGIAGHAVGWPIARGGSQSIANALARLILDHGGEIQTDAPVRSVDELPPARAILFDVMPRRIVGIAGPALPARYKRRLERYRHGPGVFKVDWALSEPIPWTAEACTRAGTVHLGGTLEEIAEAERAPWEGRTHERPFVLLVQPSLFDPTRAPPGHHTAWAYCHVPTGSDIDMTRQIEAQVERYAPGFRATILERHTMDPSALERRNPNLIGGDITGGANTWLQTFFRPTLRLTPYATPNEKIFICSSATPPGGGVHGMCGFNAAGAALKGLGKGKG